MKRNLIVRIVAIFLCALMVLSVVTAALYAFAAETAPAALPETGSSDAVVWVIVAIAIAVIAISVCLASSRKKK